MDTNVIRLCDAARAGMKSGDLLLYRASARQPIGWIIARLGRSQYCHAGRAYQGLKGWRTIDTHAWTGGRNVALADEVRAYPRRIDVFSPNPGDTAAAQGHDYDPEAAVRWLQRHVVDRHYGWWAIAQAALRHAFLIRLFVRPFSGENGGGPAYCSQAQAAADRHAGFDPVRHLADRLTEPSDLARSPFYRYRFTLEV